MNDDKQALLQLKNLGLLDTESVHTSSVDSSSVDENLTNARPASADIDSHQPDQDNPWFLQLLFGLSGMLASLFFIGFLTLLLDSTGALDSAIALFIIGLLLSASGFVLFKSKRASHNIFLNSLALTISIAGQSYVMYALMNDDIEHPFGIWLFLFLQSAMTFIVPNFIYRLLSSLAALGCMVFLLNYYHLHEVSLGLLALIAIVSHLQHYQLLQRAPVKWRAGSSDIIKALGYASTLMLLCISVYFIAAEYNNSFATYDGDTFSYNYYLAQGLLTLASLYAAYLILKRYHVKLLSAAGLLISGVIVLLGIISIYVSGLLATSLIIIIATANSQRVLLELGIIALVGYVFWYYYQLDTSLLVKSASMLVIGISLLLLRWMLIRGHLANIKPSANDNQERPS
ncbi:DUF4401 domain-containing protein [Psychrobacter sp. ANT_WB68]|uniref:DUF4401 domain-containing protein n=1 Tax=Psychrobacter sp. ANT_WB68 TaxID=2597355 RepID=UPI00165DB482|nr:DUF4401 domain-containing protein [Psychrobacter sp. ANT_WB68]